MSTYAKEVSLGRKHSCGADSWLSTTRANGLVTYKCAACTRVSNRSFRAFREDFRPALRLQRGARERARNAGIAFSITVEDIEDVWPKDGRCPALGILLAQGRGAVGDASPTLDRLDPARGYELGNIAVISNAANRAKGNLSADEMERLAAWVRAHSLSPKRQ